MASRDTVDFVYAADCKDAAREIASKVVTFSGCPTEDEVLSRLRHVFEYTLHYALVDIDGSIDLDQFSVEVESDNEPKVG